MPVAILDISAACHTPDVLEMPYRPEVCYLANASSPPAIAGQPGNMPAVTGLAAKSCSGR